MSRLNRRKTTMVNSPISGGIGELMDAAFMEFWYVTESEYIFIINNTSNEELDLIINCIFSCSNNVLPFDDDLTFSEYRKASTLVNNLIKTYNKNIQ